MFLANKLNKGGSLGGYQISRNLRFNSADTTNLTRTPASASSRTTWTWSGWIKRSGLSSRGTLFSAGTDGSNELIFYFENADTLYLFNRPDGTAIQTTQVFRDPSAWYHIVLVWDTTQATASNRLKLYINGVQVTSFATSTYPASSGLSAVNNNITHYLGMVSSGLYYNGYMTEVNFIDGQALTPSSFGETNAQTGVWQPKAYSGSYGTNGFYLNFSDNSNTTAATLGKDYSGNGNNWTPNNFSVTAGAGNDSMVDVPTPYGVDTGVGGSVRGNYCTLNTVDKNSGILTNGNLTFSDQGADGWDNARGTIGVTSGKWYWEVTATNVGNVSCASIASPKMPLGFLPGQSSIYGVTYYSTGDIYYNNNGFGYGNSWTTGDVIGVALDMDSGKVWFSKNNTFQASGNPVTGTNPAVSGLLTYDTTWMPCSGTYFNSAVQDFNFGQRPFAYTAPSGFKALCTQNLPTPTIGATTATQAGKYFNPVLYTGTGSSLSVTGVGFQPDWVWVKGRSGATDHGLYDAVRGVQKQLESNTATAETTETTGITAFGSDGFTTGSLAQLNTSAATYVAWNWKANGSGSSNTAGTINSTVSANTTSGFSVVTYTNAASGTVGHGLGVAPAMVIYKDRTNAYDWIVLHQSLTNMSGYFLRLNATDAVASGLGLGGNPTSSVIYTNSSIIANSASSLAYCFAEVAGYSKFGSYTGNGSADGPFVYCGFKPAYVMIKATGGSGLNWGIWDVARNTYNLEQLSLYANSSTAEINATDLSFDGVSNGFKVRGTSNGINQSGITFIFMAFAESPFKYSLAR
jgi:hypothetical protein